MELNQALLCHKRSVNWITPARQRMFLDVFSVFDMLTKHSFGVYSTRAPETGFRHATLQAEVDVLPKRQVAASYVGDAVIESYTVLFEPAVAQTSRSYSSIYSKSVQTTTDPSLGIFACRLEVGRRTWANLDDADVLQAMCHEEFCGRMIRINANGTAVPS